jgi:hypothetical protein
VRENVPDPEDEPLNVVETPFTWASAALAMRANAAGTKAV